MDTETIQGIMSDIRKGVVSTGGSEVVVVKGRKPRGPKKRPPFYILPTADKVVDKLVVDGGFWYKSDFDNRNNTQFLISPYTNYIPIHYLLYKNTSLRMRTSNIFGEARPGTLHKYIPKFSEYETEIGIKLLDKLCEKVSRQRRFLGEIVYESSDKFSILPESIITKDLIAFWLEEDEPLSIPELYQNGRLQTRTHYSATAIAPFCSSNSYTTVTASMRSYRSLSALLTIYKSDTALFGITWRPSVLAVVLPEDYIYHKLHLLATNTIDLSKVIVFVDRELDNTSYPIPAFRKMYKSRCEPFLKTLGCQTYKVPVKFIEENCFLPDFKLLETNRIKRHKEKQELIEKFYKLLCGTDALEDTADMEEDGGQEESLSSYRVSYRPSGTISYDTGDYTSRYFSITTSDIPIPPISTTTLPTEIPTS